MRDAQAQLFCFPVTALAKGCSNVSPQSPPNKGLPCSSFPFKALISRPLVFRGQGSGFIHEKGLQFSHLFQIDSSLDQDPLAGLHFPMAATTAWGFPGRVRTDTPQ